MNKALDFGKLLEQQKQGKLLKKQLKFPLLAQIKHDGNYCSIVVKDGKPTYYSSKPKEYLHPTDNTFKFAKDGVYIAERIYGDGKLGDRTKVALSGKKELQTASSTNRYKVHDYIPFEDYNKGFTSLPYRKRLDLLFCSGIRTKHIAAVHHITDMEELENYLDEVVKEGYEGIVMKDYAWKWKLTNSRTTDFCKWKKRPTADLKCIGVKEGEGKYEGQIGSLLLVDSAGRLVNVGSGLSDDDRLKDSEEFLDRVIEIEYEQILDTYIQPTFICVRDDKTIEDID